jgi:uncharacterized Fe-S cluster-containing MiaB family protein
MIIYLIVQRQAPSLEKDKTEHLIVVLKTEEESWMCSSGQLMCIHVFGITYEHA